MDIQEEVKREKALGLSFFYLKFRPRTEKEVRDYLHKKAPKYDFTQDIIDATLVRLKELKFVDDKTFIEWYVRNKMEAKPRSVYLLKQELFKKGAPRQLIDDYFVEADIDQDEAAYQALSRKWRTYNPENSLKDPQKMFQRAVQFLMRKGFSYDAAKKAVARKQNDR